ncbi:uncharacterized protein LOC120110906 isoform X2 [Phoenix dactylifera]|uniref:Uncharacterized protein LOC120110906 isoform X2 n=1 Tax=Phoenix dactylifera TaxID=42345 RepID=A0A8B9AHS6_PHODC|nr:uncharacterized protein LOC120110906 isoform X2 [Phoenix dactylifera]
MRETQSKNVLIYLVFRDFGSLSCHSCFLCFGMHQVVHPLPFNLWPLISDLTVLGKLIKWGIYETMQRYAPRFLDLHVILLLCNILFEKRLKMRAKAHHWVGHLLNSVRLSSHIDANHEAETLFLPN